MPCFTVFFWGPPPKFFGGESSPPKFRGYGLTRCVFLGAKNWTQLFFSRTFEISGAAGISQQNPGISAQKVWFPWFWGTYRTFWPPPLHMEDPYPTGKYPNSKVWVWVLFPCLIFRCRTTIPLDPLKRPYRTSFAWQGRELRWVSRIWGVFRL